MSTIDPTALLAAQFGAWNESPLGSSSAQRPSDNANLAPSQSQVTTRQATTSRVPFEHTQSGTIPIAPRVSSRNGAISFAAKAGSTTGPKNSRRFDPERFTNWYVHEFTQTLPNSQAFIITPYCISSYLSLNITYCSTCRSRIPLSSIPSYMLCIPLLLLGDYNIGPRK